MKTARMIGSFMIGMMVFSNSIYSQQDTTKGKVEFIVKADVLMPFYMLTYSDFYLPRFKGNNMESLTFETCFANRHSIQITDFIFNEGGHNYLNQIIPEYKYFLNKYNPFNGFYCGATLKYLYAKSTNDGGPPYETEIDYGIGEGVIIGYQRTCFKHLVIDFLIGVGEDQILHVYRNFY